MKLRVGGVLRIAAAHAHSADVQAFHRRTYHLLAVEGEAEESEAFWLSLVHYRACEPREDASRKIRRDRGRALQLAAKEVERQIAKANLDGEHSTDELSDEVLANAVNELLSEDQLHAARVVEGAVDAFTGTAVPSVKLERQVKPAALVTASPIQQQDPMAMTGELPQNDAFKLHQHDQSAHKLEAPFPTPAVRNQAPSLSAPGCNCAFRIVEASPMNFSLCASDVERKVLVALDGALLYDPVTRMSNHALALQPGSRIAIRFIFAEGASHSNQLQLQFDSMETVERLDVDAKIVNACTLCCTAPLRAEYARASLQVVILGGSTPRCLSPESPLFLTWGAKPKKQIDDRPLKSAEDIPRQRSGWVSSQCAFTRSKVKSELSFVQQALQSNATIQGVLSDQCLLTAQQGGVYKRGADQEGSEVDLRIRASSKQRQAESPPKMNDSLRSSKVRVVERDCSLGLSPQISNLLRSSKVRVVERDCTLVPQDRQSELPLEVACPVAKDDEIIKDDDALASLPEAELHEAVERLVLRVVKQMSKLARTNADLADELDTPDQHGFGLLHYCALYNLSSVISELLALGAHPDGRAGCPMTPLHLGSSAGHAGIVSALLLGGADPSATNAAGRTPHDCAVDRDHFKVASLLEDYHADELRVSPQTSHSENAECSINNVKQTQGDVQQHISRGNKEVYFIESNRAMPSPARCIMTDAEVSSDKLQTPRNGYSYATKTTPSWPSGHIDDRAYVDATTNSTSEINKALLHTAFSSLSLHEKCALSIAEPKIAKLAPAPAPVTRSNESSVEVTSVISDSDKESLDVAMSLMGASELRELEDEARVITANVRSWIVRRKYIKVRDAARTLETRWILRKRSSELCQASMPSPRNDGQSTLSGSMLPTHCTPPMKRQDSAAIALSKSPRHQDFVKFQAASRGMCVVTFPPSPHRACT